MSIILLHLFAVSCYVIARSHTQQLLSIQQQFACKYLTTQSVNCSLLWCTGAVNRNCNYFNLDLHLLTSQAVFHSYCASIFGGFEKKETASLSFLFATLIVKLLRQTLRRSINPFTLNIFGREYLVNISLRNALKVNGP